jgi:hypothetical protein
MGAGFGDSFYTEEREGSPVIRINAGFGDSFYTEEREVPRMT